MTETTPLPAWRKWGTVVVLALALSIIIIDGTLLNVSFSYLIRDLHTDLTSLQWVITAYSLTLAALTITGGRLGDFFGRKRMFMLGAIIFALGSLIASESHAVSTMIIGESIIEGIGAALMMPATLSLLVSTFRGRDRAIAMGIWGGIAGASSAVGPILGGYLTSNYSWRWGFRINVVVAAVLLIGSVLVNEYRDEEEKPSLDIIGVFLSSFGLLSLVFGIIESSQYGWWKAKEVFSIAGHSLDFGYLSIVPFALAIAAILLSLFYFWQKRVEAKGDTPLISLGIFKNQQFTSGSVTTMVMAIGQAGLIFSIPIFFQAVRGFDAFHTGLALLPTSLTALVVAPLSAFLNKHIAPKRLIQFGLLIGTTAFLILRQQLTVDSTTLQLTPALILFGLNIGLVMSQLSNMTLSAVSPQEAGEASGINNTLRQIGTSLGTAVIGAILLTALSTNLTNGIQNSTVIPAPMKQQIASAVSHQTSNVEFGGGAQVAATVPAVIKEEITKVSHQATVDANKVALAYTALLNFIGFLVACWLPHTRELENNQYTARKQEVAA
jgi:EmrB/QacA subfamily drug resistance transporter